MKWNEIPTPSYVVDEKRLIENLEILRGVEERTGCKILLAQKAFSMFYAYPLIARYVSGTTASGLYEAKLGREEMGKENHVFCAAFKDEEFDEIAGICDHISFNSFSQLERFRDRCEGVSVGIRVNPECSTQEGHAIYDPCAPGSRLGVTLKNFREDLLQGVEGLHFHTLCEQDADDLKITLDAFEEKFGRYLKQMKWINLGGGHHITRKDYKLSVLEECIHHLIEKYDVDVYLEPGEAFALNAGYLVTEVLDIVENDIQIALLDASAACHMPDVLEMPYRPPLRNAGEASERTYTYRLAGATCLSGDVIGDYSFDRELRVGDRLVFEDMAIYSMVKNNTFNGMALPNIMWMSEDGDCKLVKKFGYEDFKGRLS